MTHAPGLHDRSTIHFTWLAKGKLKYFLVGIEYIIIYTSIYAYHNSLPIRTILNAVTVAVVRLIYYRHVAPHLGLLSLSTTKYARLVPKGELCTCYIGIPVLKKSTLHIHKNKSAAKYCTYTSTRVLQNTAKKIKEKKKKEKRKKKENKKREKK